MSVPFLGDGGTNDYFGYIFGASSVSENGLYVPVSLEILTVTGNKAISKNALKGCNGIYTLSITGCPEQIEDGAFKDLQNLETLTIPYVGKWAVEPQQQGSGSGASSGNYTYGPDDPTSSTGGYVYYQSTTHHVWFYDGSGWDDAIDMTDPNEEAIWGEGAPGDIAGQGTQYIMYFDTLTSDLYVWYTSWEYQQNLGDEAAAYYSGGGSGSGGSSYELFFGSIFGADYYSNQQYSIPSSLQTVYIMGGNGSDYDTIPEYAFYQAELDTIVIGGNVKTIEYYAFYEITCDKVIIEDTVENLENNCFAYYKINELTIPFVGNNKDSQTRFIDVFNVSSSSNPYSVILTNGSGENGDVLYDQAFQYSSNVQTITLPNGIKEIGQGAFSNCSSLVSVNLPNDIKIIKENTFDACTSLQSITIPNSVTEIQANAFSNCSNLVSVYLPAGLETLGDYAFYYCGSLQQIALPNSLETIGESVFYKSGLVSVVIPENVSQVGSNAFKNCSSLVSVLFKEGAVRTLGDQLFYGSANLKRVVIEGSVSSFGSSMFTTCTNLEYVSLPSGMTTLANNLFKNLSNLKTVILPDSITSIGNQVFYECSKLESITIPSSVQSIGTMAFYNCKALKFVYFNEGLTTINNEAFRGCDSLKSLVIPSSVTTIGTSAFRSGTTWTLLFNLKTVYGNSNSHIYNGSYDDLASQTSGNDGDIYLVNNVVTSPYYGCIFVRSGTGNNWINQGLYKPGMKNYDASTTDNPVSTNELNHLYVNTTSGNVYISCSSQLESITLDKTYGDGIGKIFASSSSSSSGIYLPYTLKTIVINNATSLAGSYFGNARFVENIFIDGTASSIGRSFCDGCTNLINITLPNSIASIDVSAFIDCTSLTSFVMPNMVKTVSNAAFKNCTSLKHILLNDKIVSISKYAFMNCSSLEAIALPSTIQNLGIGVFNGCTSLKTMSLSTAGGMWQQFGQILYGGSGSSVASSYPGPNEGNDGDIYLQTYEYVNSNHEYTAGSIYRKIGGSWDREYIITFDNVNYVPEQLHAGSGLPDPASASNGIYINTDNGDYYRWIGGSSTWEYTGNIKDLYNKLGILFAYVDVSSSNNLIPRTLCSNNVDSLNANVPTSLKVVEFNENGETTLGNNLQGCTSIEIVTLPSTVTTISDYAFAGCTSLKEISNPEHIQSIGEYAFQGTSYEEISGFDSLQTIGSYAFANSSALMSAEFSSSLSTIGEHAFQSCVNLESIRFSRASATSDATVSINGYAFKDCISMQEVINSRAILNVGEYAFAQCEELKSINLSNCLDIGNDAFRECYSLASVVMPISSTYTFVNHRTFLCCYSLTNIKLSQYVTDIGSSTFEGCYSLSSLDLRNVVNIKACAFLNCTGVTTITLDISKTATIEDNAFSGCDAVTSIVVYGASGTNTSEKVSSYNTWLSGSSISTTGNEVIVFDGVSNGNAAACPRFIFH